MAKKIIMEKIDTDFNKRRSLQLCKDSIAGAETYHHTIPGESLMDFPANCGFYRIFILIEGKVVFASGNKEYAYDERVTFIPAPDMDLVIKALSNAQMLEVRWKVSRGDDEELKKYGTVFPVTQLYKTSKQYVDRNKSEKTISRVMVEQRNIPGFCIGSVESFGYDLVKPHDHPMLDQFFFSFPENDMDVIIDGEYIPMGGNVLMHIPLGADHGVEVKEGKHMHYMWIDFMVDETAMTRLDTSHRPTGLMRSFDESGREKK